MNFVINRPYGLTSVDFKERGNYYDAMENLARCITLRLLRMSGWSTLEAGAHTDFGSLTILLPESGRSGLQILSQGVWIDVPAPELFVVKIGDLMGIGHLGDGPPNCTALLRALINLRTKVSHFSISLTGCKYNPISGKNGKSVVSGHILWLNLKHQP